MQELFQLSFLEQPAHLLQLAAGAVEQVGHGHHGAIGGRQVGGADDDVADVAARQLEAASQQRQIKIGRARQGGRCLLKVV